MSTQYTALAESILGSYKVKRALRALRSRGSRVRLGDFVVSVVDCTCWPYIFKVILGRHKHIDLWMRRGEGDDHNLELRNGSHDEIVAYMLVVVSTLGDDIRSLIEDGYRCCSLVFRGREN